jgi:predicted nucleic acid-binding protein
MIIDTSIWIDFFRDTDQKLADRVNRLIDDDQACYNGPILTELLRGVRSEAERNQINDNFSGLRYLESDENFFNAAGDLGRALRERGIQIPFVDLLIATHAKLHKTPVLTKDKHFVLMQKSAHIPIEFIG